MQKRIGILAVGLLFLTPAAHAEDFEAQIVLRNKKAAANAVVWLEGTKKATPMPKVVIDQREKMFQPHVSVVTVGTTVEFPNNDTVFHNVFAYFNAKKFDLGMYPRGTTKRVTFDKAGMVALLCNVHSEMSAYIIVVDTPYYVITDKKGKGSLPNVPPGTYTLHIWHESGATVTKQVEIKENVKAVQSLTLEKKK